MVCAFLVPLLLLSVEILHIMSIPRTIILIPSDDLPLVSFALYAIFPVYVPPSLPSAPRLKEHLNYLLKYLPPSPPEKKNLRVEPIEKSLPRSACPSPTPIFQQLYLAVAHWERYLRDSPDFFRCRSVDVGGPLRRRMPSSSGTVSPAGADGDEEEDEEVFRCGGRDDGTMLMAGGRRRNSYQVGTAAETGDTGKLMAVNGSEKLRRRSSPADFSQGHHGITIRISDDQCGNCSVLVILDRSVHNPNAGKSLFRLIRYANGLFVFVFRLYFQFV